MGFMIKPKLLNWATGLAVLLTAAAGVGRAGVVTYSYSWNSGNPQTTNFSYTLPLPLFNNVTGPYAGATLTAVKLIFYVDDTVSGLSLTNNTGSSGQFNFTVDSNAAYLMANSVSSADVFHAEDLQLFDTGTGTATGGCNSVNGQNTNVPDYGCSTITISGTNGNNTYSAATYSLANTDSGYGFTTYTINGITGVLKNVSASNFSKYEGTGNFNLSGQTLTNASANEVGYSGQIAWTINGTIQTALKAAVEYDYTGGAPTPEPATMGLAGSALIGLALVARKFARR